MVITQHVERQYTWHKISIWERTEEDRKGAKAAHCHACWLFWLPRPTLLPSSFSVLCLLPPGSGQKWASAFYWALKSFGFQPSVALYLQPSVKGPPAATHRSTSLPWPRGSGARSGDGAGRGTHWLVIAEPVAVSLLMNMSVCTPTTPTSVAQSSCSTQSIAVHFIILSISILTLPPCLLQSEEKKVWGLREAWLKPAKPFLTPRFI